MYGEVPNLQESVQVLVPMRFLIVVGLLLAVVAGEYNACGRPDAVWASWDQVIFHAPPNHRHAPPPVSRHRAMRSMLIANHTAWTGERQVCRLRRYSERR